jgi:hypothetical protein
LGLSTTSQQYFSLRTNQPSATSNQPAVLFSQNKSAPGISHQPNEQAGNSESCATQIIFIEQKQEKKRDQNMHRAT